MPPDRPAAAMTTEQALRPLILAVVAETVPAAVMATVAALESQRAALPADGRLAYPEAEAARLLGLRAHQLRDCRLRGEIEASVGPGRKVLYTREQLLAYLAGRRWTKNGDP
jgi:hypothetical protein